MAGLNKAGLADLYANGLSLPDIERITGIPRSTVRNRLISHGVSLRERGDAVRACGKLGDHLRGEKRGPMSQRQRQLISDAHRRRADVFAAGKSLKPSGYIEFTRGPHKGRTEHVVAMEERIGRKLLGDEVVHHVDGNRSNNHPDNLALMTRAAHMRLHRREDKLAKEGKSNGRA